MLLEWQEPFCEFLNEDRWAYPLTDPTFEQYPSVQILHRLYKYYMLIIFQVHSIAI